MEFWRVFACTSDESDLEKRMGPRAIFMSLSNVKTEVLALCNICIDYTYPIPDT